MIPEQSDDKAKTFVKPQLTTSKKVKLKRKRSTVRLEEDISPLAKDIKRVLDETSHLQRGSAQPAFRYLLQALLWVNLMMDLKGVSFMVGKLFSVGAFRQHKPTKPDLTGIKHFADFFSLDLRKRITAMAGDYEVEINRIFAQGRCKTAHWNKAMAWAYAIGYVLRGPFDFLYWCGQKLMKLVYGR